MQEEFNDMPVLKQKQLDEIGNRQFVHEINFRRDKKRALEFVCTACRHADKWEYLPRTYTNENVDLFNVKHKESVFCPQCGTRALALNVKIMRFDGWSRGISANIGIFLRASHDKVWLRMGEIKQIVSAKIGLSVRYDFREDYRYSFEPGKICMYTSSWTGQCWQKSGKVSMPFRDNYGNVWGFNLYGRSALQDTFLQYYSYEEISKMPGGRFEFLPYLMFLTRYPLIEQLCKAGYKNLVEYCVNKNRKLPAIWNLKAKSVKQAFFIPKNQMDWFRTTSFTFNIRNMSNYMRYYRDCGRDGVFLADCHTRINNNEMFSLCKRLSLKPVQLMKYLVKQYRKTKEAFKNEYLFFNGVFTWYKDYIYMSEELNALTPEENVILPPNLKRAHDRIQSAYNAMLEEKEREKNKALDVELMTRLSNRKALYEYSNEFFAVCVPSSCFEIIEEGKILHHCVAGYADRNAKGQTNILFIRKKENLDVPYFTLEMRGSTPIQVHGEKDCDIPRGSKLEEFYRHYIALVKKRDSQMKKEKTA